MHNRESDVIEGRVSFDYLSIPGVYERTRKGEARESKEEEE